MTDEEECATDARLEHGAVRAPPRSVHRKLKLITTHLQRIISSVSPLTKVNLILQCGLSHSKWETFVTTKLRPSCLYVVLHRLASASLDICSALVYVTTEHVKWCCSIICCADAVDVLNGTHCKMSPVLGFGTSAS